MCLWVCSSVYLQCAKKKKKDNGPKGAKYFSLLDCLTITGKNLFATPRPLTLFFLPLYNQEVYVDNITDAVNWLLILLKTHSRILFDPKMSTKVLFSFLNRLIFLNI